MNDSQIVTYPVREASVTVTLLLVMSADLERKFRKYFVTSTVCARLCFPAQVLRLVIIVSRCPYVSFLMIPPSRSSRSVSLETRPRSSCLLKFDFHPCQQGRPPLASSAPSRLRLWSTVGAATFLCVRQRSPS